MKKIIKTLFYAGLLAAVASCGGKKNESAAPSMMMNPEDVIRTVEVAPATRREVPQENSYASSVEAYATNNIMPQQAGRIRKINVEVGDYVVKGQILAEMDRMQLEQLELQIQNDDIEYARLKSLYEEGGVSQSDFEAAELGYKLRKSSYDNMVENTILRSPLTGFVTARNFDKEDMYSMSAPIFTVQQVTPVKLLVGISETDYTRVKKNDVVSLTVDALPGRTFSGRINRLYPTLNPATHTFQAEVVVPNNDRALRPGMYARVTVTYGVNNSIVVSDQAIVKQEGTGQRYVYLLNADDTVHYVPVELGRHIGTEYEILSGIEEGQLVVVKGQSGLKDGLKVEVLNR